MLAEQIQGKINSMDIPPEVNVQMGGAVEDMMESMMDLMLLLVLSLVLTYLVMASQFESLKMPFIIMFSIPFAFSGVYSGPSGHRNYHECDLHGWRCDAGGYRSKKCHCAGGLYQPDEGPGYELREAIVMSGKSRLRPVLMTSLTTILGMLPLAMSTGDGSEIWSPMGIAVIGGLIFSTMVTLILIPVIYQMMLRKSEKRKKLSNMIL